MISQYFYPRPLDGEGAFEMFTKFPEKNNKKSRKVTNLKSNKKWWPTKQAPVSVSSKRPINQFKSHKGKRGRDLMEGDKVNARRLSR
jgi:hypothetical protein